MEVTADLVRRHYDRCSTLYARLWGEDIHHGYWEDGIGDAATAKKAQVRLTERLAESAVISLGMDVLDAGCGFGGSSLWLARRKSCRVTAVTLSVVQADAVRRRAVKAGLAASVSVKAAELETLELPESSLDVVWMIESSEHLRDKQAFFLKAGRWLRPGGRFAVCAWTRGEPGGGRRERIEAVCRGFVWPSLATAADYAEWFAKAGAPLSEFADLTTGVMPTWDICLARVRRPWVRAAAALMGAEVRRFCGSFGLIRDALRDGVMHYSLLVGEKPRRSMPTRRPTGQRKAWTGRPL